MFRLQTDNQYQDFIDYITRMAYIAELKEWDNRLHLERIRKYCGIIGSGLDLSRQEVDLVSAAAVLHDIGKISIPEELLKRTGNIESFEWEVIENHTIEGAKILSGSSSPILQTAESIALTHHERWDGTGYPQRLRGENIPVSGRILALADVFDALTTRRSYKEELDDLEALRLIVQSSGSLFDPRLVRVFEYRFDDIIKAKKSHQR
jgi:putative two-component system response regulator